MATNPNTTESEIKNAQVLSPTTATALNSALAKLSQLSYSDAKDVIVNIVQGKTEQETTNAIGRIVDGLEREHARNILAEINADGNLDKVLRGITRDMMAGRFSDHTADMNEVIGRTVAKSEGGVKYWGEQEVPKTFKEELAEIERNAKEGVAKNSEIIKRTKAAVENYAKIESQKTGKAESAAKEDLKAIAAALGLTNASTISKMRGNEQEGGTK